jgi:hypothetical protein
VEFFKKKLGQNYGRIWGPFDSFTFDFCLAPGADYFFGGYGDLSGRDF